MVGLGISEPSTVVLFSFGSALGPGPCLISLLKLFVVTCWITLLHERMVFVGVNVAHSELTKWVMRYPALGPFGLEGPFGFLVPFGQGNRLKSMGRSDLIEGSIYPPVCFSAKL